MLTVFLAVIKVQYHKTIQRIIEYSFCWGWHTKHNMHPTYKWSNHKSSPPIHHSNKKNQKKTEHFRRELKHLMLFVFHFAREKKRFRMCLHLTRIR